MKKILFTAALAMFLFSSNSFAQSNSSFNFHDESHGKKMGVAVNPVLALFQWGSGEINLWNVDKKAEINIPVQYAHNPFSIDDEDNVDLDLFMTGINYRRFFNEKQSGFFAQAGWHYMHGSGSDEIGSVSGSSNSVLFGFGYRVISKDGFFWGTSFSMGKTWGSIKDNSGDTISGSGLALDIDLLKFGIAW